MKKTVAILTSFADMNTGYSLTGIVSDQIRMLVGQGHKVKLFVCTHFNENSLTLSEKFPEEHVEGGSWELHKKVPFAHLIDYASVKRLSEDHKKTVAETSAMLVENLQDVDVVFTHDFIFTGWNLPYGLGCLNASNQLKHVKWMHWIHSVPSGRKDWWDVRTYGKQHKLIFPNASDRIRVAEHYMGEIDAVRIIPHIKDLRTFWDFADDTCKFLQKYPSVMQSEIVKVYPASTDRLTAKGVHYVIEIFANFKRRGIKACLVIANQWATGKQRKEDVEKFYKLAEGMGLVRDVDFIFTSEWETKYATGLPKNILRELLLCSNLFIFPTKEESFGLVAPEAELCGCFTVLNKSLSQMLEIHGPTTLYFDFGSYSVKHDVDNWSAYLRDISIIISGRLLQNEMFCTKTRARTTYNWDTIYTQYYEPIIAESEVWGE